MILVGILAFRGTLSPAPGWESKRNSLNCNAQGLDKWQSRAKIP
jgi:hypothetical protein